MSEPVSIRPEALSSNPDWYKDAIIYEVRVRSYLDSNGDGVGDLLGLTSKLDYLQDLGVTAIWLLPIYPSPGRDDGYDISDYVDVAADTGTVAAFQHFLEEAHRRGLRVITELVLNHTSDQHAWFQRARRAPRGSPERDFYVWSDAVDRYAAARVIFKDFEQSNWAWDPIAQAHYWHRFYTHQPDLNFDNPAVHEAMFGVVDFWFGLGVDGLRLDAVPYLYEREGTSCENLPETHAFLRKLRAHIDGKFRGRMLLAEANQWPDDAAAYFGDGDECHMNFHFPIMPRMFMAIRMEDRFPIVDILDQTPALPPNCQWALFLRNHDELTLEMVTDEERDYMYQAYANEPAMRLNLGIRRRLAPLVGNDRRMMELLNGLLFSLPGAPVIYYGDEIGMGDNVFLGDRNGVRTPMQWSSDRNAGFSRANPQRLILPIVVDPEYHFESINVEAQQNNPSSLLWWTKRLIALRKRFQAFGRGSLLFLQPSNARVLAFVRRYRGETILVVANLSRAVQYVELDLAKVGPEADDGSGRPARGLEGMIPVELFGRTRFPPVGDRAYPLTLGSHAFYWFSLEEPSSSEHEVRALAYDPPTIECPTFEALFFASGEGRALVERALPRFLESRKWFEPGARGIRTVRIQECVALEPAVALLFVRVEYEGGSGETYALPLAFAATPRKGPPPVSALFAHVRVSPDRTQPVEDLVDVLEDKALCPSLLHAIATRRRASGIHGSVVAAPLGSGELAATDGAEAHILNADHWNAVIRYDDRYFLKVFRRMEEGRSPELEVGSFLAARAPGLVPEVLGAIEYLHGSWGTPSRLRGGNEPITVAVLERFVPNEGSALDYTRRELERFYEQVLARSPRERAPDMALAPAAPPVPRRSHHAVSVAELAACAGPEEAAGVLGAYAGIAALLGKRTAEMHLALASGTDDPAFRPEPYTIFDRRSRYQSLRNLAGKVLRMLRARGVGLPMWAQPLAKQVLASEPELFRRFEKILRLPLTYSRIRCHGDFHLGQVLYTGKDFVIIDFDGGHERELPERRRKRSALRDVAGALHSLVYAVFTVVGDEMVVREADRRVAWPWAELWQTWASAAFLGSYLSVAEGAPFLPRDGAQLPALLESFQLEKALRELGRGLVRDGECAAIALYAVTRLLGLPDL